MDVSLNGTTAENNSKALFKCDKCPKVYSIVMRFKRHKENHHKEGGPDLTKAPKPRKSPKRYRAAMPRKSKSKRMKLGIICEFCQEIFHERKAHRRHQGKHAENRTEICTLCSKKLTILYFIAQNVYFYTWQCKRPLFLLTFSPRGVKVNKDCDLLHRQVQIDT